MKALQDTSDNTKTGLEPASSAFYGDALPIKLHARMVDIYFLAVRIFVVVEGGFEPPIAEV